MELRTKTEANVVARASVNGRKTIYSCSLCLTDAPRYFLETHHVHKLHTQCPLCGRWFTAIGNHLRRAHNMSRRQLELMEHETVDHPAHYGGADNPYEAIKIIDHYKLGFGLGNAVKYILRAGRKPDTDYIEDLKKARWYLDHEIEQHEAKAATL